MNKAELIRELSKHFGSRTAAAQALDVVVDTIADTVSTGEKVTVTGFGVFEKVDKPPRTVRNPRTGERKDVPATSVVRFRPGTDLKAAVSSDR